MAVQEAAVNGSGVPVHPGTNSAISTGQTANPAQVSPEEQRKIALKASIDHALGKVNKGLEFSQQDVLVGITKGRLSQLVTALQQDKNASVDILPSALGNDGNQETRLENVRKYLSSQGEAAKRIKLPNLTEESKPQDPADTINPSSQEPKISEKITVNNNISTIGLLESGIQKSEIPSKEGQPLITVLHRGGNQTFAHIVVSAKDSEGVVKTTIARVEQGTDLTQPITGANVWTKSKGGKGELQGNGTGSVTLTEDQQKDVAEILKNLKQKPTPKPAESEKPAKPEKPSGKEKPEEPEKAADGKNSAKPGAGAGSGSQAPAPNGGTPTPPPQPTEIKFDGQLDKSEMMRFLTEVGKSSGSGSVTEKIKRQFPDATVTGDAEKITLNFEGPENPKVTIYWKNGSAGVDFNGDEERKKVWTKQFEQRVKAIVADPNSEPSASASRLMGNPSAVKDLLQRPYVFLSLQAAFGERNVSRDGTDIVVRDLIPFRNVHLKPSGEIELRQAGLFLPELPDAARTAELTAEVENRLRKFNGGLAKLGDSQGFNQDDKKAVKAWLSGQNADEFKKRLGDGFSTLDNGIKFRTTGYEFIIQESGTVGVRKIEGPFGGGRRPITGGLDLTKAKAVLEGVMADTR